VLFTMPQYFQGVRGLDAMGSGLRLLPLVGGLVLGSLPADRIARRLGVKGATAAGFALLAGGLALGSVSRTGSDAGFVAAWMALVGAGMGLAMATATAAALSELPEERSGVGSAALQALNKIGGPLGAAIFGSVLSAAYISGLHLGALPAPVSDAMRDSVFGGVAVAQRLHSPALLHTVRTAFVHGMDVALLVSACIALAGAFLAAAFLPQRRAARERGEPEAAIAG
jgi:Na+/melibiose symporter-like transporter